jgi:hypothetical protein
MQKAASCHPGTFPASRGESCSPKRLLAKEATHASQVLCSENERAGCKMFLHPIRLCIQCTNGGIHTFMSDPAFTSGFLGCSFLRCKLGVISMGEGDEPLHVNESMDCKTARCPKRVTWTGPERRATGTGDREFSFSPAAASVTREGGESVTTAALTCDNDHTNWYEVETSHG